MAVRDDVVAVVLAAGVGSRVGADAPKQFRDLNGTPVLARTLSNVAWCARILVVHHPEHLDRTRALAEQAGVSRNVTLVPGGSTRRLSVSAALAAVAHLSDGTPIVLQNAASPNTPRQLVTQCLDALDRYDVVQAFLPAIHTIFQCENGELSQVLERSSLGYSVDPTVYRLGSLRRIVTIQAADGTDGEMTLDTARALGIAVRLIASPDSNVKLTTRNDLVVLQALLADPAVK